MVAETVFPYCIPKKMTVENFLNDAEYIVESHGEGAPTYYYKKYELTGLKAILDEVKGDDESYDLKVAAMLKVEDYYDPTGPFGQLFEISMPVAGVTEYSLTTLHTISSESDYNQMIEDLMNYRKDETIHVFVIK